ncbi:MAG: glutamate--tRNA ligase [Candidatus Zambryskibacteria bacterium RIFCSPHIGHO2_02_39_10]|nr:MAG: glutamate--tRNA ligase [Candidatus Zambryskibacteria bacterium RIFCSPHIGHO2_02_39_10]OHA99390.1 MAG: glutamate--tRNA ligase [Candidatus Zambryskibacteria bacterium RIFCSPHIGHO2_12_FULL_39_47]
MQDKNQKIITRFPPSPTGPLHIGNVRTALFNYFFARQNGGQFIVRVEDTDKVRSKKEYELGMLDSLKWLGLSRDGQLWHQSERVEIYKKYLRKLIDEGKAYVSQETEGDNKEVIRFKNPNKVVTFTDLIRGEISFDTTELKDFIIARNINEPVYHLSVVVDDFQSGVTHVIRGDDHVSNTPRQILIGEALGVPRPVYAHLPLILAKDRSKLSKRKHGQSVSLDYYQKLGYLPGAIVNYLSLVGWNPGTDKEIFTIDELIKTFDITQVQKGGAIFDPVKLDWLNKEHMKRLPKNTINKEIYNRLKNNDIISKSEKINDKKFVEKISETIFNHISKWGDIDTMTGEGELSYFFEEPQYEAEKLLWKESSPDISKKHLMWIINQLDKIQNDSFDSADTAKNLIFDYATENGKGEVLWPLRLALSGKEKSPDPFTLIYILGKSESISRISNAIKKL